MKIVSTFPLATGVVLLAGCTVPENQSPTASSPRATNVARANSQQKEVLKPARAVENGTLNRYMTRDEPVFAWKEISRKGQNVDLEVTSQTWQGIVWKHRVEIVRPARNEFPDRALLNLGFGGGSERETFFSQLVANAAGATIVNAWNIPNQPLFDKREDDLIAHTFAKYLQDGDETWPLLLPMTKSAGQIMRAVAQWSSEETKKNSAKEDVKPLTKWVVSGASKRGWTTWLTSAAVNAPGFQTAFKSDGVQVVGIIPMVYDNLNLPAQMPHQLASWGKYSAQIDDYARRGLPDLANTPEGQKLVQIVDPYSYRDEIDVPTLIVNGSNDAYWPLDSFNLYKDDLFGPTNVFIAPNSGHPLNGNEAKVAGISVAWFRALAAEKTLPQLVVNPIRNGRWEMTIGGDPDKARIKTARVWFTPSATRDFRQSKWQSLPLEGGDGLYTISVRELQEKLGQNRGEFLAAWGEIELESDLPAQTAGLNLNLPFLLSSPVTIWKD